MGVRPQMHLVFGVDDFSGKLPENIYETRFHVSDEELKHGPPEFGYLKDVFYDRVAQEWGVLKMVEMTGEVMRLHMEVDELREELSQAEAKVLRLREALAKQIHKRQSEVANALLARDSVDGTIAEWYEECQSEVERLREELEQCRLSNDSTTAYMEIEAELHTDELRDEVASLRAAIEGVAIPSLLYCEKMYDHDDMARLNLEATLQLKERVEREAKNGSNA